MDIRTVTTALGAYAIAGVLASVYARMLADANEDGTVSEAEYDAKMGSGIFRLFYPVNAFMKLAYGYVWPFPSADDNGDEGA